MYQLLTTAQLVKKYQLASKKSLGQNFIYDKNFTDKIVRESLLKNINHNDENFFDIRNEEILEIGGGPGSLSRSILDANVKKLTIIEKDKRCILALNELKDFYKDRLEIIEGDALEIDFREIFGDKKFRIIANLPYNIGTPLLFRFLELRNQISSIHLMLQKEVVCRITAKTGEDHYGRLAVMVNFLCDSKLLFLVDKKVFNPPPKVTSAIVEIIPKKNIDQEVDLKKLQKVVAFAFNQRRKMIKSALRNIFFDDTVKILESCNINPNNRAEQLSINDFCNISKKINDKITQ